MKTALFSTSRLKTYKIFIFSFVVITNVLALFFLVKQLLQDENLFIIIFLPLIWYSSVRAVREAKKYRTIYYDDSSVYYEKDGYEVQIPFEDIKSIELYRGWSINLYRPTQDGDRIMFLPSLWYPLNFKVKDAEVNELRDKIDRYKRAMPERNFEGLSSHHI